LFRCANSSTKRFLEHSGDITKDFIKTLLSLIDKHVPSAGGTFKRRYLERWLQIKIFLCGETYYANNVCPIPDQLLLDTLFLLASCVANVYETKRDELKIFTEKQSMPNVDLLFLLLLYNLGQLETYGWYFTSKSIKNASESLAIQRDFEIYEKIFKYLNETQMTKLPREFLEYGEWKIPKDLHELCNHL
jgi:hypothetical protein